MKNSILNSKSLILTLMLSQLLLSCKTTEEIRREKMVQDLSVKMTESQQKLSSSQKSTGSLSLKVQNLENHLSKLQGNLEESQHQDQQTLNSLNLKVMQLEEKNFHLEKRLSELTPLAEHLKFEVNEQKNFLKKVLQTMEGIQKNLQTGDSKKK